jgi:EAL domain-containing protein (putative c-di-GMP-specific phosphodiesterase class I)
MFSRKRNNPERQRIHSAQTVEVFHMLKRMGKSIVCEGVETQEIADFLKNEGCNEIQGFLYYRPMCQEDFEKLILK